MADPDSEKIVLSKLIVHKSKRRLWVFLLLASLLLALAIVAWIRATWSPSLPEPTRASEGVVCGDHELTDGTQPMKCTFVVDKPLPLAHSVIIDYPKFSHHIPYVATVFPLGSTTSFARLLGVVHWTPLDHWSFEARVTYQHGLSDITVEWDAQGERFRKNKGSCILRRMDAERTQVSCLLDVDLKHVPWILEKNILLTVWPQMMSGLKTWMESIKQPPA